MIKINWFVCVSVDVTSEESYVSEIVRIKTSSRKCWKGLRHPEDRASIFWITMEMLTFVQNNTTSSPVVGFCSLYMCLTGISMGNLCSILEVVNAISGIQSLTVKSSLCLSYFSWVSILKMQSLIPWDIIFLIRFPSLCTYFFFNSNPKLGYLKVFSLHKQLKNVFIFIESCHSLWFLYLEIHSPAFEVTATGIIIS